MALTSTAAPTTTHASVAHARKGFLTAATVATLTTTATRPLPPPASQWCAATTPAVQAASRSSPPRVIVNTTTAPRCRAARARATQAPRATFVTPRRKKALECVAGLVCLPPSAPLPAHLLCADANAAAPPPRARAAARRCTPTNAYCNEDKDCCDPYSCISGTCYPKSGEGYECDSDADCDASAAPPGLWLACQDYTCTA